MADTIRILELVLSDSVKRSDRYTLGTAIAILVFLNENTVDSAKITIETPHDAVQIADADMDKLADGIYCFTFQTDVNDLVGDYDVIVKVTKGGFTAVSQVTFTTEDQG